MPNSIMEFVDSNLVKQHEDHIDDILAHISSIFRLALNCCTDSRDAQIN